MRRGPVRDIYVVGDGAGPVKIGITGNLKTRLYALSNVTKRGLRLVGSFRRDDGDAALVEKVAHDLLAEKREQGEWFNVTEQEALEAVAAAISMVEAGGFQLDGDAPRDSADPIVRASITLPAAMWAEIERFRVEQGAVTLADAIRRLLRAALRAERRKAEK